MQYTTFRQTTHTGQERTIYQANVGTDTVQTDSLEKLIDLVSNHKSTKEGTFKTFTP